MNKQLRQYFPKIQHLIAFILVILLLFACKPTATTEEQVASGPKHPEWTRNATLYEVNIRQYTPEGTFTAFLPHLERLQKLGTDILWFMPVYPIGEKNRKGPLGSYYSIRDYTSVNPAFGSLDDFKSIVDSAHSRGMHVMLDWVANHTAWDHVWTTEHPDYYEHDSTGNFVSPFDWTDVIQLDYSNHALWKEMVNAMKFWVTETDIDGFRCDYPGQIPVEFWDSARDVLEGIKPVFMLAEDEGHKEFLNHAFDMNYAWELMHLTEAVAKGEKNAEDLARYFENQKKNLPPWAYKLNCITNHDENSWSGTVFERYGDAVAPMAVLIFTAPGMPLIYSGQETGLNRRLRFFEKDTIRWDNRSPWNEFYTKLIALKKEQEALWNGTRGGEWKMISHTKDEQVLCFLREKGSSKVMVLMNLSADSCTSEIDFPYSGDSFTDFITGNAMTITAPQTVTFAPWEYKIIINR